MLKLLFRVQLEKMYCAHFSFKHISTKHHIFLRKFYFEPRMQCSTEAIFGNKNPTTHLSNAEVSNEQEQVIGLLDVFPEIVAFLKEWNPDITEANEWLAKVLAGSVPARSPRRGLLLARVFEVLTAGTGSPPEERRLAHTLGWCVDVWAGGLALFHDIMAQRVARDWHVHGSRANTIALNDAILLKSAAHCLLAEFFRGRPCYEAVTHLLVDAAENINIGKQLELSTTGRGGQVVSRLFTRQHYDAYSLGKAGYGYFYVPFMAALHMAGITDPVVLEAVEVILIKLGMLQQLQNDFQDCFREPAQSDGDDRCDIAEGKCTWLAVSALERADDNQRSLFESCYGHKDTDKVLEVKKIYEDLELPSLFRKVNTAMEDSVHGHIWNVSHAVPAQAFRLVWSSPIADGSNGTTRQDGHTECVQNSVSKAER